MTSVGRFPRQVREFAAYLDRLLSYLDQRSGWCAVFWGRDPEGMKACLDGHEVPPWDVVEALLQDLAVVRGADFASHQTVRARVLHTASTAAHDALPGARHRLGDRLNTMLDEQRRAGARGADLTRRLQDADLNGAEELRRELAWTLDDQARATARCGELRARIARLDAFATSAESAGSGGSGGAPGIAYPDGSAGAPGAGGPRRENAGAQRAAAPPPRNRPRDRPRGARFAGAPEDDADARRPAGVPTMEPPADGTPRGARFAGSPRPAPRSTPRSTSSPTAGTATRPTPAAAAGAREAPGTREDQGVREDPRTREEQEVAETVAALHRLRAEGRGGEAHMVLVDLAFWPARRFPLLAGELSRAGLTADWPTLLWEAASLPLARLAALADTLIASGLADDGGSLLRQGVTRPPEEVGEAVLALVDEGRDREARALLDACVRVRSPEGAARCAHADPARLVPLLSKSAEAVSEDCHRDLVHALRVAGLTG